MAAEKERTCMISFDRSKPAVAFAPSYHTVRIGS